MREKKTLVLTSRENFVWHSMQEIIPMIESRWLDSAREGTHIVGLINVDETSLPEIARAALGADQIVLTCFTSKLIRAAQILRRDLALEARYFIYLHNQATIGCWPYHAWGLGEVLGTQDIFISSCARDVETFRHSFENARVVEIPFTLPETSLPSAPARRTRRPFVYVGRISAQKNIHGLIQSFALLAGDTELLIFGKEDDLGSPNMGIRDKGYLKTLQELASDLSVAQRVRFLGHLSRERLQEELYSHEHIFVSSSLHSDENFGMAAFRSLTLGQIAVLSDWGGHAALKQAFPGQVFSVEVSTSRRGPWVPIHAFAQGMEESQKSPSRAALIPQKFSPESISETLLSLALSPVQFAPEPLRPTSLAKCLIEKQRRYTLAQQPTRIFDSYEDMNVEPFFQGYGMRKSIPAMPSKARLVPWAKPKGAALEVRDPHRGSWSTPIEVGSYEVESAAGELRVSESTGRLLASEGLLFEPIRPSTI